MSQYWLPILFTLLAWWISTGVVLILNRQSDRNRHAVFILATILSFVCFYGSIESAQIANIKSAYLAFTQALIIWAWCEMSYFMGYITGTRKEACPEGVSNWRRFILAIKTSIHHELLVIFIALVLLYSLWSMPNQVGLWTFVILWLMRWSTKLNIFLGVSNLHKEWIPKKLEYIISYTKQKSINYLFPISVSIASFFLVILISSAVAPAATSFEMVAQTLLATLLLLAILEHWFLLLPVNDSALWKWAVNSKVSSGNKGHVHERGATKVVKKKVYVQ